MEDDYSNYAISYRDLTDYFDIVPEIVENDIEVDDDTNIDPAEVLQAEIGLLQTTIVWDAQTQGKLKSFLETLREMQVSPAYRK